MESERERRFSSNIARMISSKVAYILEICDKRERFMGSYTVLMLLKIILTPCAGQMNQGFTCLRGF